MSYLSVWLLIRQITIKFLNKNQSEWNSRLPQAHITQLYRMNHRCDTVSHALWEKSSSTWVDLIVGDSPPTNLNQNVPTYVQGMKTTFEEGRLQHTDTRTTDAKAVGNPNHIGNRRTALKHMPVAGPMCHYRKDFWCGLPSSEGGWATAGAGGLQQSEMLPRTKEDQPPANAICNPEMKNRNLIRHQETSRKTNNEKKEWSLVVTRGQQGTTKDHLLSSNYNEWTSP